MINLKSGDFVLRPLESADLDTFLQLGSQTCGSLHKRENQSESDSMTRFRAFVRDFAFRPESEIWVAVAPDTSYAGHLWLTETSNRFNGIKELWVWDLTVSAAYRRQGLGHALMKHARERAVERKCLELWLLVEETNSVAQRLYSRTGLRERARMMALEV
ncbi:MAG: GNAT family N-acetyltransferase [bacterium]|nr:GNAT family N-acetyltransferase [bacterium]